MSNTETVVWPSAREVPRAELPGDALECWSVTSILATLHRFGLELWKQQQVARTAFRRRDTLATMAEREAVAFLTRGENWQRDHELTDMECGSAVHHAAERYVLDDAMPAVHPEAAPFVDQWTRWRDTMRPKFEAVEMTVFDPHYLYAGTLDAIVVLADGKRYLIDYKTTRNDRDPRGNVRQPYAEWSLQLAAYRRAPFACTHRPYVVDGEDRRSPRRYYISPDDIANSVVMPAVDGCAVLQLTPETWRMYPVRVETDAYNAFLYVREVQRFLEVIARKSVFGSYVEGSHSNASR